MVLLFIEINLSICNEWILVLSILCYISFLKLQCSNMINFIRTPLISLRRNMTENWSLCCGFRLWETILGWLMTFRSCHPKRRRVVWVHIGIMRTHKHFLMMWITTRWSEQCASFPAAYVIRQRSNQMMVPSVAQGFGILSSWRVIYSTSIDRLCAVFVWREGRYIFVQWLLCQDECPNPSLQIFYLEFVCWRRLLFYLYHTGIYLWTKTIY